VILADRRFQGLTRYWPEALVKPIGAPSSDIDAEHFMHHDSNRVIVEQ
jgi:hypothetical protein